MNEFLYSMEHDVGPGIIMAGGRGVLPFLRASPAGPILAAHFSLIFATLTVSNASLVVTRVVRLQKSLKPGRLTTLLPDSQRRILAHRHATSA
jgi:hypothetical protein